jgi:hypothetical protein
MPQNDEGRLIDVMAETVAPALQGHCPGLPQRQYPCSIPEWDDREIYLVIALIQALPHFQRPPDNQIAIGRVRPLAGIW